MAKGAMNINLMVGFLLTASSHFFGSTVVHRAYFRQIHYSVYIVLLTPVFIFVSVVMPFDFKSYTLSCQNLSTGQLQKEWGNYTRQISGSSVGTAVSILGAPFSLGISLVNLAFTCPRIDNARHKRAIIEAILVSRGETHHTRKRDVLVPVAWSAGLGAATFGLAPVAAEAITDAGVAGCVAVVAGNPHFVAGATGLVLDAVNDGIEVEEDARKKRSEAKTSS